MTHNALHTLLAELLYIEDRGMIDIILASIVANSMKLGDPVWLTLIGPSSGGKSQIIRPFSKANPQLIHRIDDLTPNTLISGTLGMEDSLLGRIGKLGIISMDDLTVLFSKNQEARAEILAQFRMLYDGRFSKSSGNRKDSMVWEGYIGMISGSTPSIYRYFNEVADMGERFVSYRMKAFDKHKAVNFITAHRHTAHNLDEQLSTILGQYLRNLISQDNSKHLELSAETLEEIAHISEHCTLLRTPVHIDERTGLVDEFPEPEMPFRVMKQLTYLAQGLQMVYQKPLDKSNITPLLWTAYSLCNDKRRAYLKTIVGLHDNGKQLTARNVSSVTGLHSDVCKKGMDQLQALGIIELADEESGVKRWSLVNKDLADISRRLDGVIVPDIDDESWQ
jgi:hypothetical protein